MPSPLATAAANTFALDFALLFFGILKVMSFIIEKDL